MPLRRLVPVLFAGGLALAACDATAPPDSGQAAGATAAGSRAAAARVQRLREIVENYYDAYLELNPLLATSQGDHRHDDRFGDYVSTAWMADSLAIEQDALQKLAAVEPGKLSGEELLTYEAFRFGRESRIEGFRYPGELLPLEQVSGLHLRFAMLGSGRGEQPFRTTEDYDRFLARMDGFVRWVDRCIDNLGTGAAKGVVQPRAVIERIVPQLAELAVEDPRKSVFWQPILNFPAGISVADRQRLIEAYADKIGTKVLPAYRRLHDYLQGEYLAQARDTVAWSELPNGAAWYAYLVRYHTTTTLTPDEIHELGLSEVSRIRGEMERFLRTPGPPGDLRGHLATLRADRSRHYEQADELLAAYRALNVKVGPALPLLFPRKPRAAFEIRAVESFRAASAASTSYVPGDAEGTRPGVVYVNTGDLPARPKSLVDAMYLHEAVPGRHYQVSLAQEADDLPRFRRFAEDTAHGDGWASYAESLGKDLGVYADPDSVFGALTAGMWRAAALVVDTGIHAKGWTREQAIDYLRAQTALGDAVTEAEVDRCIARPGQALAYTVGRLRMMELRRRAQDRLGARFDIRAFHAQLLESGPLPLPVLEAKVDRWLEAGR
jgi:uncharacterized protein (DUF885 family)